MLVSYGIEYRKSGKETTCINWMFYAALRDPGTYFYFFPDYTQGKKVLWFGMDRDGNRWIDHYLPSETIAARNNTDMRLELVNGSIIQVVGVDKYKKDKTVGVGLKGCVFSEYSVQDPSAWQYMEPALIDTKGWAVFNFTPRGHNHAHELYQSALRGMRERRTWHTSLLTVDDTKLVTLAELDEMRASGTPEEVIQQEYFCSFSAMNRGTYFGPYLDKARTEKRITVVPHDPALPVHTAWDLGVNDPTVVWFFQRDYAGTIRLIDYYEATRKGLDEHIAALHSKREYVYGTHLGPHDLMVTEWGTNQTRYEQAIARGLVFHVVPRLHKDEQISAARSIFHRLVIDETRCATGLDAIEQYAQQYDDAERSFKGEPGPKWTTHAADALMVLALGLDAAANDTWSDRQHVQTFADTEASDYDTSFDRRMGPWDSISERF